MPRYLPLGVELTADHIDSLWGVCAAGITYADKDVDLAREVFTKAFDSANGHLGVAWNLMFGLRRERRVPVNSDIKQEL